MELPIFPLDDDAPTSATERGVKNRPRNRVSGDARDTAPASGFSFRIIFASSTTHPFGRTSTGLKSMLSKWEARSIPRRPMPTSASTSAGTSAGFEPRNPASSLYPRSSSSIDLASFSVMGSIRNETSRITSVSVPPMPAMITGPNWGSFWSPTITSTPPSPDTMLSSRIPFTSTPFFFDSLPCISEKAALASAAPAMPTLTPPTSVLWSIWGETTFMTSGKPISAARFSASSADRASACLGTSKPYEASTDLASSSVTIL